MEGSCAPASILNSSSWDNFAELANNSHDSAATSSNNATCVIIEWDDWDLSLWTTEQRKLLEQNEIPRWIHITLGVFLSLVVLFGVAANSAIFYVFSRFKRLRTPANVFIINLTICDFCACCLHPMAVYSAFRGRWSFGQTGCNLYGMGVAFFGLNSIITLSAIACERYIVITSSSCRPSVAKWRITRRQAQKICAAIWLHCAALVTPPWLFGWSSFLPEGVLVTCSWDYMTRTLSNRLYYLYLLFFGFIIPIAVLTFCYASIFRFIIRSSKEMTRLIMTSDGRTLFSKTTVSFRKRRRQTDIRTALNILTLAMLCYTAWTPYAIVSLIGQFGPVDENGEPEKLSPMATAIPAFLAKTAIVFDPLIYGFSSPEFRASVRHFFRGQNADTSVNGVIRGGANHTAMIDIRRPVNENGHPAPSNLHVVFSSVSESIKINSTESTTNKLNDSSASAQSPKHLVPAHGHHHQPSADVKSRKPSVKRNNSLNYQKSCRLRRRASAVSHRSLPEEASSMRLIVLVEENDVSSRNTTQPTESSSSQITKTEHSVHVSFAKYPRRLVSEPHLSLYSRSSSDVPGSLTLSKSYNQQIKAPERVARDINGLGVHSV
ncbi:pineal opsin-like [Daphnia carinata]|uniref:pineal opsin-like n=1 Tax=Daphnia carinata TaxID=120202 RepID=UPI00257FBBE2|nr:pineal opsin-like [Daphnia carinata]